MQRPDVTAFFDEPTNTVSNVPFAACSHVDAGPCHGPHGQRREVEPGTGCGLKGG